MIIAIRIAGMVNAGGSIAEALHRMRLRRKYAAVLLEPTKENVKLLAKVRNNVAYGVIDEKTLSELITKRGQALRSPQGVNEGRGRSSKSESENINKKVDMSKVAAELDKKSLEELGLKPFFRLHPPRGGIDSKTHFGKGKGVLGDNKEKINALVRRML